MNSAVWRVASLAAAAPAHLLSYTSPDGVRAMACNWVPRDPGFLLPHKEMLSRCKFACVYCMRAAKARGAA